MPSRSARSDRIRVVHLTTTHFADDARIFTKECVSLAQAGHDVTLVIPDNRYRTADGQPVRREGVNIVAVERPVGLLPRLLKTGLSVLRAAIRQTGDVYHFHDPELIPGGVLLRLMGKTVIYDVHEDLPRDLMTRAWIPLRLRPVLAGVARALEWVAGKTMSGVVAATPIIARRFPKHKTVLVQNFAMATEFANPEAPPYAERGGVAFVGTITESRCAVEVVEAIGKVERFPEATLLMAGSMGSTELQQRMEALPGWRRVDYRGRQDRAGVQRLLGESRVGLVLYYPTRNYREAQPVKLYEYMAAGIPLIVADFPYMRSVVEESRCGLCVPPCDTAAVAAAIEWLFEHPEEAEAMGRRGREAIHARYCWENEQRTLVQLYERILAPRNRAAPSADPSVALSADPSVEVAASSGLVRGATEKRP